MDCLGVLLFCLQYLACHNGGKRVVQPVLVILLDYIEGLIFERVPGWIEPQSPGQTSNTYDLRIKFFGGGVVFILFT